MKIGITGATGFVGRALVMEATYQGHEVVAFSRNKDAEVDGAHEVREICQEGTPLMDMSDLDALVHLAGENVLGAWSQEKKRRIYDSRVDSTQRIVTDLAKAHQQGQRIPSILLCGSGSGAYGNRGDEVLTETSSRGEGFLAEVCRDWEDAALQAEGLGVRVVLLRTGMVLGEDGGAWPLLQRVFRHFMGSPLASGKQWVPWIHRDDEVGLILHALQSEGCRGPMNLGSPNPVTNEEMSKVIARRLKRPVMPKVPEFVLRWLLRDLAEMVLSSQRMMPQLALSTGYEFKFRELDEAVASLI